MLVNPKWDRWNRWLVRREFRTMDLKGHKTYAPHMWFYGGWSLRRTDGSMVRIYRGVLSDTH